VTLAFLLILAQAVVLQHQSEHPISGFDVDCPVCLTGNALDHPEGAAGMQPAPAGGPALPAALLVTLLITPTLPHPTARGPPHRL
jgi:hypothetical protein